MKNLIVSLICLLILVEARSKKIKRDTNETIDLIEASKNGDIETIQSLPKNEINVNQTDIFGRNALHWASREGHKM